LSFSSALIARSFLTCKAASNSRVSNSASAYEKDFFEGNGDPTLVNDTTVAMASTLKRPTGSKKARQMDKHDKPVATFISLQEDNINTSNELIAHAMENKNRLKETQKRVKERHVQLDNFWKTLKYHDKKGNELKVDEPLEKIEGFNEQEEENERSISTEELAKKILKQSTLTNRTQKNPTTVRVWIPL
jgi:predicted acyl esterase